MNDTVMHKINNNNYLQAIYLITYSALTLRTKDIDYMHGNPCIY